MRIRLRPTPDPGELARLYAVPHQHTRWPDHVLRVDITTILAVAALKPGGTVADLSCGDAAIANRLREARNAQLVLGDIAPGYEHTGPVEETVDRIAHVDLFLCCETLEHLDDPDKTLVKVRNKTDMLVASTPDGETGTGNPEHVWGWDVDAVEKMLTGAGFTPVTLNLLDLRPAGHTYCYQIWVCR